MSALPQLDMHAHIDTTSSASGLEQLSGVVFAVTRTLAEAKTALDLDRVPRVVWGVGAHPAIEVAHRDYDATTFAALIERSPFVGEIGLDRPSRVDMSVQRRTLASALEVLESSPRIVSLHSAGACSEVLDHLERVSLSCPVLHWWTGTPYETSRAVELGCYFSINATGMRDSALSRSLPIDRILTETDHPYGDRGGDSPRPGKVAVVESAIARLHLATPELVRRQMWQNLRTLVSELRLSDRLNRQIRAYLAAMPGASAIEGQFPPEQLPFPD